MIVFCRRYTPGCFHIFEPDKKERSESHLCVSVHALSVAVVVPREAAPMDKEVQHQEHGRDQQQQPTSAGRKWSRKERRDKGKKLIKRRDLIVLEWIAQQYAARLDHVRELLGRMPGRGGKQVSPTGLTLSAVLQVGERWVPPGLAQYQPIYDCDPGYVSVTPDCLKMLHLPFARRTPAESTVQHLHHINRVRLELERRHPDFHCVSERMLRAA